MLSEVTAILAIRNEEAMLGNCLRHLVRNGLRVAIIDNGSTDDSASIYRASEFAAHIVEVTELPFAGVFALEEQLRAKQAVAERIGGDWILHVDADELMHSYRADETLAEGLARLGAEGWNAVNFDEFVFLPIERDYPVRADGFPDLSLYYFYQPSFPRLMRAWRPGAGLSPVESGGHQLGGAGRRLAPESFALRHYPFRSQAHAYEKYATRSFAAAELARGWHWQRVGQPRRRFRFPAAGRLKRLPTPACRALERSDPWALHYWQSPIDAIATRVRRGVGRAWRRAS